jgi:hypothetical protein
MIGSAAAQHPGCSGCLSGVPWYASRATRGRIAHCLGWWLVAGGWAGGGVAGPESLCWSSFGRAVKRLIHAAFLTLPATGYHHLSARSRGRRMRGTGVVACRARPGANSMCCVTQASGPIRSLPLPSEAESAPWPNPGLRALSLVNLDYLCLQRTLTVAAPLN